MAAAPEEPPTKSPSSRARASQVAKAGASGTVMISSMRLRSRIGQICERPMPSTSWGPIVPPARIEPCGSTATRSRSRLTLRQIAGDADEGARRADAGDPRVDSTPDLLGDLGSGRFVVRLGVHGILELGGKVGAGSRSGDLDGAGDRSGHSSLDGGPHDLGARGDHQPRLDLSRALGHHDDAAIAARGGEQRQGHAGVAGGRLDDRAAWRQQPALLRVVEHRLRDPVLDASAGVEPLELGEDAGSPAREARHLDEGCRADRAGQASGRARGDLRGDELGGQDVTPRHDNKKSPGECRGSKRRKKRLSKPAANGERSSTRGSRRACRWSG